METRLFTNERILAWLQYFCDNTEIDLERVKMLDITRKNKNLIPTIESHKAVLVFTDNNHPDIFYKMCYNYSNTTTEWRSFDEKQTIIPFNSRSDACFFGSNFACTG